MSWIQTHTNLAFDYNDINPDRIRLVDIARALSQQSRFLGHLNSFYSTAEHCYHVSQRAEALARGQGMSAADVLMCARWGHLHDASEAYVGDLPSPLKRLPFMSGYVQLEHDIQAVLKEKYGIVTTPRMEEIVKQADLELCNTERQTLKGPPPADWADLPPSLEVKLYCFSPIQAEKVFLQHWSER